MTLETVLRRLEGDDSRPLLQGPDKEGAVRGLFAARLPLYEKAARLRVDGERPPREVAADIAARLNKADGTEA